MAKLGLRKNPTFESILDGPTYDLSHVHVYNRAATNFREGFFGAPEPIEEVVDYRHDGKVDSHNAGLRAAMYAEAQLRERSRQQAARVYQEGMPPPQTAHEAAAPAPPSAPSSSSGPMQPAPVSFADRLRQRQDGYKKGGDYSMDTNRLRQDARQKAERALAMERKRGQRPEQFSIASDSDSSSSPPSPRGPSAKMGAKYDDRLLNMGKLRNPQVTRTRADMPSRDRLAERRASARQIANKRELPPDRSTLRKRKKTEVGDRGRQRNN